MKPLHPGLRETWRGGKNIKENDMSGSLGPSELWVLAEEHPNAINDAAMSVEMPSSAASTRFSGVPTKYHNGACAFSFADGHSEIHKWRMPGAIPSITWAADTTANLGGALPPVLHDPDVLCLAHHTISICGAKQFHRVKLE